MWFVGLLRNPSNHYKTTTTIISQYHQTNTKNSPILIVFSAPLSISLLEVMEKVSRKNTKNREPGNPPSRMGEADTAGTQESTETTREEKMRTGTALKGGRVGQIL